MRCFFLLFFFLGNADSYLDVRRRLYHQNARNGQSMSPHCPTKEAMSINNDQQTEALLEGVYVNLFPLTIHGMAIELLGIIVIQRIEIKDLR